VRIADLGIDARYPLGARKIAEISRWRPREEDLAAATARTEAVRMAKRILALDAKITGNAYRIGELVDASPAAALVAETGIGPVTAATVLVAWSHPGRVRNEAAFAALAGVNPIPASSGNTTRHRLNRGGDRRLNRALNVIAMVRMVHHPQTRAYADRRRAEGKQTARSAAASSATSPDASSGTSTRPPRNWGLTGYRSFIEASLPTRATPVGRSGIGSARTRC
jgi:transposase